MAWLPQDLTGWIPLIVALIAGALLGWTMRGATGRRTEQDLNARLIEMEMRRRDDETALAEARGQVAALTAAGERADSRLADVRSTLAGLEREHSALRREHAAAAERLYAREQELEEAQGNLITLREEFDRARAKAIEEMDALRRREETAQGDADTLRQALEQANSAAEEAKSAAATVPLYRRLEQREAELALLRAENERLRGELAHAQRQKGEFEQRVQQMRAEAAQKMAGLTHSMAQLRDEALVKANEQIAALTRQLNAARSRRGAEPGGEAPIAPDEERDPGS